MTESFHCFQKCNRNVWSTVIVCLKSWADYCIFMYTNDHHHHDLIEAVGSNGSSLITAISWWRWWFDTFGSDSRKVMTEFIATLGNKIVITVFKQSDSDNEGEKQSFISEVGTLGSNWVISSKHMPAYEYMSNSSLHKWLLFSNKPQLFLDWPR
jgi:hypothetical protein